MQTGKQSWVFENKPVILSAGTSGGPDEGKGNLAGDIDVLHDDLWMGEDSYEKAHRVLMEEAVEAALDKANVDKEQVRFFIAGDLINQITPTTMAARTLGLPYFGIFGACSTSMEGLALASFIINNNGADYILTGTASHNGASERQYRYPTEYGGQKPPTAQWTVTGAGVVLMKKNAGEKNVPVTTAATIGKVVDMGMTDPFNMGGAMAPAAADTILAHFEDLGRDPSYYDLIVTGDLAKVGRDACYALLEEKGVHIGREKFLDCGLMIYKDEQPVHAGGSGSACCAVVTYGHLLKKMHEGVYRRILVVATGALMSPLTYQQKETIPCIAHAVSIEWI